MPELIELHTARLWLRQCRAADRAPFSKMNADPRVMAYYPAPLSREESNALAQRCADLIAERGWGFWAVETREEGEFIGFVGLHVPGYDLPFAPCVEVGWRLALPHWGRGYATEAGRAALDAGFLRIGLDEIVAFASLANHR